MKHSGVVAIVKNGLYVSALKQIFQTLNILENIEFIESIEDCLKGVLTPKILIIQKECVPEPRAYSLERLQSKNRDCTILMLNAEKLEPEAKIYCNTQINSTESEEEINTKFKSVFNPSTRIESYDSSDNSLSDREVEVVQLVALGKTNKEISDQLHISTHTVITHRKNITSKLGIKTIAGLAVYSVLNGLIDPGEVNS